MSAEDRALEYLGKRSSAYRHTFNPDTPDARVVLEDLAEFCRAHESTFHVEHSMSDRLDGRREVWLRIAHHLHLTEAQLWDLYAKKTLPKQ